MSNIDISNLTEPLSFGSGANKVTIGLDGTITLAGEAVKYDDIQGPLNGVNLYSPSGKVDFNFAEQCVTFQPSGSLATSGDVVDVTLQMSHRALLGAPIFLHIHWEQVSTAAITYTFKYRIQKNGQPKTTAWSSDIVVNTSTAGVNLFTYTSGTLNQISRLATIDMTGAGLSAVVQVKLARTDAVSGNINATFIDAHFIVDSFGSHEEMVK